MRARAVSIHLVSVVGPLPLKATDKLVLLCLADGARDVTVRQSGPGIEALCSWAGASPAQVYRVLKALVELRLIYQVGRGQKHRRAVWEVLPDGCCPGHGPTVLSLSRYGEADGSVDCDPSASLSDSQPLIATSQPLIQGFSASHPDESPSVTTSVTTSVLDFQPSLTRRTG